MFARRERLAAARGRAQRGAALIALTVLVVFGIGWLLVAALNASMNRTAANRNDNAAVLAQAKAALIARMVSKAVEVDERNPGRLPCPEAPGHIGDPAQEGEAAGSCTLPKVGRLPWRTLGLPKLLDAAGEPLWYVVSPGWAYASNPLQINSDSVGNLTVDNLANAAVALIIAPGGPVVSGGSTACTARTQQRGATPPDFCNYLESVLDVTVNPSATPPTPAFATSGTAGAYNDQVLKITAADLVPPLEAAIATRMQRDLAPLLAGASSVMPDGLITAPRYPFAAAWADPTESSYSGTIGASQGLLPLVRSRKACNPGDLGCDATLSSMDCVEGTDPHCLLSSAVRWQIGSTITSGGYDADDAGSYKKWKVTWNDGSKVEIKIADSYTDQGRIGAADCSASTPAAINCTVYYGRSCASSPCAWVQPRFTVNARTTTAAGSAFRRVNPALLDSQFVPDGASNKLDWLAGANLGALSVDTEWRVPTSANPCNTTTCSSSVILIPSLYIEDNVPLQAQLHDLPASGQPDPYSWFIRNNWHRLTYFAASTRVIPGGTSPCTGVACLAVAGAADQDALLVLAGRALPGVATPRGAVLARYLEGSNADLDRNFERNTVNNKTFNDRVVLFK